MPGNVAPVGRRTLSFAREDVAPFFYFFFILHARLYMYIHVHTGAWPPSRGRTHARTHTRVCVRAVRGVRAVSSVIRAM